MTPDEIDAPALMKHHAGVIREWWQAIDKDLALLCAVVGVLAGLVLAGIACVVISAFVASRMEARERACSTRGGHIATAYAIGIGHGPNGHVSVAPVATSTSFCLSADGRVLE
jgi:hypothetical protein